MLKDFLSFWSHKEDLLDRAVGEFNGMLQSLSKMYVQAMQFVWTYDGTQDMKPLYKQDIQINQAERHIRKMIVEHLTFQPGKGVNQSLALMSIVKDAERIGDYCKNLAEVAEHHHSRFSEDAYTIHLKALQKKIESMFDATLRCFRDSDKKIAETVHEMEKDLGKECEDFVQQMMDSTDLSVAPAIAYTLIARFFKRIVGHLGNITTSVSMPLHKLDFYDETLSPPGSAQEEDEE